MFIFPRACSQTVFFANVLDSKELLTMDRTVHIWIFYQKSADLSERRACRSTGYHLINFQSTFNNQQSTQHSTIHSSSIQSTSNQHSTIHSLQACRLLSCSPRPRALVVVGVSIGFSRLQSGGTGRQTPWPQIQWKSMKIHKNQWNQWKSRKMNENRWNLMKINENQWKSIKNDENQ